MAGVVTARRKRHDLPGILKLKVRFDMDKLRQSLAEMQGQRAWNGLDAEYRSLCEVFDQLPPFFMGDQTSHDESCAGPYEQLALTEFDDSFSLEQRQELSGTFWDKTSPHRNPKADERYYRKVVPGLPEYLKSVLAEFEPYVHRARFARLAPKHSVKPHIDYDTSYSIRLHIPIATHPLCKIGYRLGDGSDREQHLPADGSVYFVNQGLLHWATNPSDMSRIHLILSVDSHRFIENHL